MPAPPLRTAISGTPTRAAANTGFGAFWDYVTGLLGASGNASDARTALGLVGASTSAAGLVELATDGEAQTGTDTARAVTPDNLGATVLGMGQSWATQSRSLNTTYTNSTGRTIVSMVSLTTGSNDNAAVLINGTQVARWGCVAGLVGGGTLIIPPGATYRVNASIAALDQWFELR